MAALHFLFKLGSLTSAPMDPNSAVF